MERAVKEFEERDRLSELPNLVLIRILSFLPILDAVRTVLLRRFGDLWTWVPTLDFNAWEFRNLCSFDERLLPIFVRYALMLHNASIIDSFTFRFSIYEVCDWERLREKKRMKVISELYLWIQCALKKKPKIVTIGIADTEDFPLPHFLFTNQSIVKLHLTDSKLERPKRIPMGSLRSLSLDNVSAEDDVFTEIISGLSSLEMLKINECYIDNLTIKSESIQELVCLGMYSRIIIDCPNMKILHFKEVEAYTEADNVSSVRKAHIQPSAFRNYDNRLWFKFLKKFKNAEILTLNSLLLKDGTFPKNKWKCVTFTNKYHGKLNTMCIYNLVRNSPCLEELIIDAIQWSKNAEMRSDEIRQELSSPCVAPNLRKVHIHSHNDYDHELHLQLVEFLLKSAVVLDKLSIFFKGNKQPMLEEKRSMVRKFSSFTKASTHAKIIFQ